ncbi:MAG: outer membrane beta-barrel protein [Bacteroides sp.]|nr:outer membrane beta-barrel protein [Bacteroides sp.]
MRMKNRIWGWLCVLCMMPLCIQAQTGKALTLQLKDKPLPAALKLIEKEGGKSIIFSYNETEGYRINADIRQKTEAEAIGIALQGTPFIYRERAEYFVIQRKDAVRTVEIRGKVTDENRQPLAYSNVLLMTPDSTFVNGCVTRPDGSFVMLGESGVSYLLKVSFMGYKTAFSVCGGDNFINLSPDTQTLEEVTVTARRPVIEPTAQGLKANVVGTSLAQMGDAAEMIGHLPFVTGSDGSYSVLGSGKAIVYINNRKVRDTSELETLSAENILSAEVIMTPGAEYASNVGAVIRIKTLRKQGEGWGGNFRTEYSQGHSPNSNEQIDLNYRNGGLDVFVKGRFTQKNSYGKTTGFQQVEGSSLWEQSTEDRQITKSDRFNGELGFNYEINRCHNFGVRYTPSVILGEGSSHSDGTTLVKQDGAEKEVVNFVENRKGDEGWNQAVNAYYIGEIGKWTIDFNADYVYRRSNQSQLAGNNGTTDVESESRTRSKLYAFKLMAGTPIGKRGKFSVGTEESFTDRRDIFIQNGFSSDADDHIKQSAYAAFANYSTSFGKWSVNAGIRYEHQKTDYYDAGIYKEEQSPSYNDWIPSVSATWMNGNKSIGLAYRMRKSNPSYSNMDNAIVYRDKYEYNQGNPFLKPSKTHVVSLSTSYKWLHARFNYSHIQNNFANIVMPYNDRTHPGVLLFATENLPAYNSYDLSLVAAPQIGCWRPQLAVNVYHQAPDGRDFGITEYHKTLIWQFNWDNSFNLTHGWFVNVQAEMHTGGKSGFYVQKPEGQVNARISKSFLNDNLKVALVAKDILHTGYYHFNLNGVDSYMENRIYRDWQSIGIQLSYKFNATKSKYKGTGAGQSEKSRL